MTCPHCNNDRDNKGINFCTVCDEPHVDALCAKCGRRFFVPVKLSEKTDVTTEQATVSQ